MQIDTMADVIVCRDRPIQDERKLALVRQRRELDNFKFIVRTGNRTQPLTPVDNFVVAFGREPDERVRARVKTILRTVAQGLVSGEQRCETGYVYVFHDTGDSPNVLKIGRTSRTPDQRIAEWELQLDPQKGKSIILLTAYPTSANRVAERVIQELLRCSHISNRINPIDNAELQEFFTIDNVMALALFVRETLRYVDWFCAFYMRARRNAYASIADKSGAR